MSSISQNQAQALSLVDYHRAHASEVIGRIKKQCQSCTPNEARRELVAFRLHYVDLQDEIESALKELEAANAWVEREFSKAINSKVDSNGVV